MLTLLAQETRQIPVIYDSFDAGPILVAIIGAFAALLVAGMSAAVKILSLIRGVDRAVNGHSDDAPKLYDRVVTIGAKVDKATSAVVRGEKVLNDHDKRLDLLCVRTKAVEKSNNRIAAHLGLEPTEDEDVVA